MLAKHPTCDFSDCEEESSFLRDLDGAFERGVAAGAADTTVSAGATHHIGSAGITHAATPVDVCGTMHMM